MARKLAFILFKAYNNLRLWAMSCDNCFLARLLDSEPLLCSMNNLNEVNKIIRVVDDARFYTFPELWPCRGGYEADIVGRVGSDADFLYYNIYSNHANTEREA